MTKCTKELEERQINCPKELNARQKQKESIRYLELSLQGNKHIPYNIKISY